MDAKIIELLQLKETTMTTGDSLIYGCTIYEWPELNSEGQVCYVVDCEDDGRPITNNTVRILIKRKNKWAAIYFSVEALLDNKETCTEIAVQLLDKEIAKQ